MARHKYNQATDAFTPKCCPICKQSLPRTADFFYRNASRPDGLHAQCKSCKDQRDNEKRSTEQGREKNKKRCQRYAMTHRAEACARAAAWRAQHPDYAGHERLYRAAHPEQFALYDRSQRIKHRKKRNTRQLIYHALHPEVAQAAAGRRRARIASAPLNDLTAMQWREIKVAYGLRCVYCGRKMQRLTQDHITPISKGGSHTASNVVPACPSCNRRKYTGNVLCPVQPLLLTIAPAIQKEG